MDPFSHSMAGEPWTAHEWLSEVLLSLAFRLGGWSGVVVLTGAAAALAALFVGLSAARELRGSPLIATVAIGLSLVTANLLARPHVLARPPRGRLGRRPHRRARSRSRAAAWAVAPMTAWANMHGAFIVGLILIGPFALEAVTEGASRSLVLAARPWATFALAALAAAIPIRMGPTRSPPSRSA